MEEDEPALIWMRKSASEGRGLCEGGATSPGILGAVGGGGLVAVFVGAFVAAEASML